MKFLSICSLLMLFSMSRIFAQNSEAIKIEYDNIGNRKKRYLIYNAFLKQAPQDSTKATVADTITQQFKGTAGKKDLVISAYPNPVTTALIIENKTWQPADRIELKLYDMSGKLLLSKPSAQAKDVLDFGDIAAGMYTVYYYLGGKMITYWKVMKNNTK